MNDGYLKAQRQYDAQLPPSDDSEECPECDGSGLVDISNCCGVPFDTDIMMCAQCKDHCDRDTCENCNRTGKVYPKAEKQEAREAWLEDKADAEREEWSI